MSQYHCLPRFFEARRCQSMTISVNQSHGLSSWLLQGETNISTMFDHHKSPNINLKTTRKQLAGLPGKDMVEASRKQAYMYLLSSVIVRLVPIGFRAKEKARISVLPIFPWEKR